MAVKATTVVVDKSLTEAKAAKEGLIFNVNAFKVLADFYSSGSIWDNWSAGTLYLRDASSVLTQSDFEKLDGRALSITGNVTDDDPDTIPAKNSLTFNGVSYTHDENENPFSVTHFLNITVKDSVFANTVISKNYTTKRSSRNDGSYAVDYSNNGSANISNSTIDVLMDYKNVTMLNSSAATVTSAPEGRLTLTPGESGELSGTGTLGFGGSFTAKFDREQEDGYKIGGISGFKNVTLTGLDPRKFPENTTKITVGSIVGGKIDYAYGLNNPTYYSDGSFSVSNGINVADVSLFANVTVKDSSVGDIVGGESAMTVKSVTRNGMEIHTATWRTGGRVTVNNSSVGNIIYYDSVALTNSSSGNIFRDPLSKVEINSVGEIQYQYTASAGSVNVKADAKFAGDDRQIVIGKSEGDNADPSIYGYANVNISGYRDNRAPENNVSVDVDGDIVGGNAERFSSGAKSDTATGSITLANDVTVNGDLFYFANVTVKDGSSAGAVVAGDAVATEKITVKNGIASVTTTYRTGGRVTVANSCVQDIWHYDSVSLTNSSSGLIYRNSLSQTVTAGDTNYEYHTAAGSVNVRADAKFAGEGAERIISIGDSENDYYDAIEGYANVNISGYRDNRAPENNVSIVVLNDISGGNYGFYGIDQSMPMANIATGSVTLANDVTVNGALLYFSNVTVKDGSSVSGLIDGGEFVGSSRSVKRNGIETVTTTWRTGGRVTVANSKVNDIKNYDSVTLTNSGSGAIYRDTLSKWEDVRDAEDELIYSLVTKESKGSVNVRADAKFAGEGGAERIISIGDSENDYYAIEGYANVNISGYRDNRAPENNVSVMVKGNITGGNLTYDTLTNGDEQTTASGSITLANDVTVNGKISFFSNVNIKESVVGNKIVYGDRKTTSKNSTKFSSDPSSEYRSLVTTVTYKNDGKLTAANSKLGQVSDYANVSLTNTDGGDISRNMLASDIIAEYQERQKNEEGKWGDWQSSGSEEHHTYSAAGSVTVRADKSGWDRATMDTHGVKYFEVGDIDGYMNVTVNGFNDRSKNNQDIKVQAGNITGGSYEGVKDGDDHPVSALGSANFNFASVGNVFGYKSVNAVDTNINGNVIAGSDAGFDPESNDWASYYGSYTYSSKGTANGFNASGVAKSADRFSLTNGWVEGDVRGYNVVTLTGGDVKVKVKGTVDLGVAYSDGHSYSDVNGESSSEYHKTTATASATVRNAEVGGDITGYRMVTVDNSSVEGDIEFIDVEREDDAIQISTSYFNDGSGSSKGEITGKEIATGSLTVRDSEVNGNIRGYNSVNFTNGSAGKEKNINNWIYNYNAKYSIKDGETVENNATLEYKASGNFTARVDKKGKSDLYQFGSISGFEKVAISGFADKTAQKSVIVNGSITGGKLSIKGEADPDSGFLIGDIPEINASDSVFAASGSVVLEKKVTVRGDIYGFDSVTVKDSAVAGEIKATPYEFDFKAVPDYVDYSEFAVSGKLVNLTDGKAGRVTGYKQVNISGIYNEIDYYTGTAGDDTLKIAGNSALRVKSLDFGEGEKDKLLLEGTLIIDDPINLNWALESVSGRGAIAAATDNLADAESVCGTDINFIDLGDVADGFKGAAWELADDSAVKAAFWDGESFLTGWLCGDFDSNYKTVVDTVDYIRFTATDDGYLGFGGDANIIAVSGWEVGNEDKLFTSNNFYVAAGSEYIIKLEREDANSASYTVKFNPLA